MNADLLPLVFDYLANDYSTLFSASLANKLCSVEAARLLYARVVVNPKTGRYSSHPGDAFSSSKLWSSAIREKNARHVRELVISNTRIVEEKSFKAHLQRSFRAFKNLQSLDYTARHSATVLSTEIMNELTSDREVFLHRLNVSAQCLGSSGLDTIVNMRHLKELTVDQADLAGAWAVAKSLPNWLQCIQNTRDKSSPLKELHLLGFCSELRNIVDGTRYLTAFSLGTLTGRAKVDLSNFLRGMRNLQFLRLQYGYQSGYPPDLPNFPQLRAFTIESNTKYTLKILDNLERMAVSLSDGLFTHSTNAQYA